MAGILTGGILAGIWPVLNPFITTYAVPSMIPGFFLSLLSIYLISLATNGVKKEAPQV